MKATNLLLFRLTIFFILGALWQGNAMAQVKVSADQYRLSGTDIMDPDKFESIVDKKQLISNIRQQRNSPVISWGPELDLNRNKMFSAVLGWTDSEFLMIHGDQSAYKVSFCRLGDEDEVIIISSVEFTGPFNDRGHAILSRISPTAFVIAGQRKIIEGTVNTDKSIEIREREDLGWISSIAALGRESYVYSFWDASMVLKLRYVSPEGSSTFTSPYRSQASFILALSDRQFVVLFAETENYSGKMFVAGYESGEVRILSKVETFESRPLAWGTFERSHWYNLTAASLSGTPRAIALGYSCEAENNDVIALIKPVELTESRGLYSIRVRDDQIFEFEHLKGYTRRIARRMRRFPNTATVENIDLVEQKPGQMILTYTTLKFGRSYAEKNSTFYAGPSQLVSRFVRIPENREIQMGERLYPVISPSTLSKNRARVFSIGKLTSEKWITAYHKNYYKRKVFGTENEDRDSDGVSLRSLTIQEPLNRGFNPEGDDPPAVIGISLPGEQFGVIYIDQSNDMVSSFVRGIVQEESVGFSSPDALNRYSTWSVDVRNTSIPGTALMVQIAGIGQDVILSAANLEINENAILLLRETQLQNEADPYTGISLSMAGQDKFWLSYATPDENRFLLGGGQEESLVKDKEVSFQSDLPKRIITAGLGKDQFVILRQCRDERRREVPCLNAGTRNGNSFEFSPNELVLDAQIDQRSAEIVDLDKGHFLVVSSSERDERRGQADLFKLGTDGNINRLDRVLFSEGSIFDSKKNHSIMAVTKLEESNLVIVYQEMATGRSYLRTGSIEGESLRLTDPVSISQDPTSFLALAPINGGKVAVIYSYQDLGIARILQR